MNANIQTSNIKSATPLFKAGQFVRIKGGEIVGRVLEDTDAGGFTKVKIFDDPTWTGTRSFGPGCLTMWTPVVVIPQPAPLPPLLAPLDLEKVNERLMKIITYSDLARNLGDLEMSNEERSGDDLLPFHLKLIGSAVDDTTCDLLEMIENEERRLRQAA
jgi:hypothetical protein